MKEFIKSQKITYNLMSFTGFKALVIFSLLSEGPKTFKEISNFMLTHQYLREKISIDTFRVYMNSLKRIGCEIKRTRGDDKISRYEIVSHPFQLTFNDNELNSAKKVYKSIVKNIEIKDLLNLEKFFEKIGNIIGNEDFINTIKNISMLKDINTNLLNELIQCCDNKYQIAINYNSPHSGNKIINIITDKIEIHNNKIYLFGTGLEYNEYSKFLVNRIIEIIEVQKAKLPSIPLLKVKYKLKCNPNIFQAETNEKILTKGEDYIISEIISSNKFNLMQKFLEYGNLCTILEPENFKQKFIELLKQMKDGYHND